MRTNRPTFPKFHNHARHSYLIKKIKEVGLNTQNGADWAPLIG